METLGSYLRNLLTPYKNLIQLNKDGMDSKTYMESVEINFKELLEFSHSDEMENTPYDKK